MTLAGRRFTRLKRRTRFRAALISPFAVVVAPTAGVFARRIPYEFTGNVGQVPTDRNPGIIASSMRAVTTFSPTAMGGAHASAPQ